MMELRGEIPGLLRRGSPVTADGRMPAFWAGTGVVVRVYDNADLMLVGCCSDGDMGAGAVRGGRLALDLSDPTGRFHARLWLREHGYDMGTEDSAEVLAWSVLSVSRGGGPIRLVMGHWWQQGVTWRRDGWRGMDKVTAAVGPTNCSGIEWEILTWFPNSTSRDAGHYGRDFASVEAAKAACDAAAIASRWALTNPDGSLTLPPLPGAP